MIPKIKIFINLFNLQICDKYILQRIAASFAAILFLLVMLIWFSRATVFVEYITENGVGLRQFFWLFLLILPWLLLFIIPISLFVAVLLIYNRLLARNEITILQNSGLTKARISKSTIIFSVILSIFCFVVSFYLMPLANKNLRLQRRDFSNNYSNISFSKGTFEMLKKLTIYTKDKDDQNNLSGILVHDARSSEYAITITAKKGNLKFENSSLLLYMKKGTVQKFNYATNKEEILNFDDYVFNLSENNNSSLEKRWKAKERFLSELLNPNDDSTESDILQYKIELHQRIAYPLASIILTFVALAFVLRGNFNRSGNIKNVIVAILIGIIFFVGMIAIYRLLEISLNFLPLLYLHLLIFLGFSIYILTVNDVNKTS